MSWIFFTQKVRTNTCEWGFWLHFHIWIQSVLWNYHYEMMWKQNIASENKWNLLFSQVNQTFSQASGFFHMNENVHMWNFHIYMEMWFFLDANFEFPQVECVNYMKFAPHFQKWIKNFHIWTTNFCDWLYLYLTCDCLFNICKLHMLICFFHTCITIPTSGKGILKGNSQTDFTRLQSTSRGELKRCHWVSLCETLDPGFLESYGLTRLESRKNKLNIYYFIILSIYIKKKNEQTKKCNNVNMFIRFITSYLCVTLGCDWAAWRGVLDADRLTELWWQQGWCCCRLGTGCCSDVSCNTERTDSDCSLSTLKTPVR